MIIPRKKTYEHELVPLVTSYIEDKNYLVYSEQYIGMGRADIVGLKLNMNEVKKRIEHNIKYIPAKTFFKLLRILDRYGEIEAEKLYQFFGLSKKYIDAVIFSANPLYVKRKNGKIRKIYYRPYVEEIIAVEVKVRDWKTGLIQAYEYLYATDKSYLALTRTAYENIPDNIIDWIKRKGIGILVIDREEVWEAIQAKKQGPKSQTAYFMFSERLWVKVLRTLNHFSR